MIALHSLSVISKTHQLEALAHFLDRLTDTADDRKFIFEEIIFENDSYVLNKEDEQKLQNVVNFLNQVGLLLDNKLLSSKLVLSLSHTVIIRCCYIVIPYTKHREEMLGGRYGRRLEKLQSRAQRYHDANPKHRNTAIKLPKPEMIIYKTDIQKGFRGLPQQLNWAVIRALSLY